MDRIDKVILTNMCMVYDGTKILVEEKVGENYKGIIFPGGHIEENEPIVDSVIHIFSTGEFAELFLDSSDDWKPILK